MLRTSKLRSHVNCPAPPMSLSPSQELDGPSEITKVRSKLLNPIRSKDMNADAAHSYKFSSSGEDDDSKRGRLPENVFDLGSNAES